MPSNGVLGSKQSRPPHHLGANAVRLIRRTVRLNVPMGQSRSWSAQGWGNEMWVRLRLFVACGVAGEGARLVAPGVGGCNGRPC